MRWRLFWRTWLWRFSGGSPPVKTSSKRSMTRSIGRPPGGRWWPWAGWLTALLLLAAVAGCASGQGRSPYRVAIPTIVAPKIIACTLNSQPTECVILLKRDHEELVRQLKGACLALGQSKIECLAE